MPGDICRVLSADTGVLCGGVFGGRSTTAADDLNDSGNGSDAADNGYGEISDGNACNDACHKAGGMGK